MIDLRQGNCLDVLASLEDASIDALITDPPAGIGFMGKEWDHHKGGRDAWIAWMTEVMAECLRVLKPGAHGLVWGIPRTSHWTATALENAGFEVRDVVTHLFGSGFPKSTSLSKAIDKMAGAEREVVGSKLGMPGYSLADNGRTNEIYGDYHNPKAECAITAPATDEAKQWDGFGTALKPASEHWILVRKPISEKTIAKNVLKHGCGGLNIDGCRINNPGHFGPMGKQSVNQPPVNSVGWGNGFQFEKHSQGRFPANLVLSHNADCTETCTEGCAVSLLDGQANSGCYGRSAGGGDTEAKNNETNIFGKNAKAVMGVNNYNDKGGASRFFYCAKASKKDKGADNNHPTVKNTKIMEYLIKLITPPNGVVLDPFMGSGSTGVSAQKLGFQFVGIEKESEYFEIAKQRID